MVGRLHLLISLRGNARAAKPETGPDGRWWLGRLIFRFRVLIVGRCEISGWRRRSPGLAETEHDLEGGSLPLLSNQNEVVAGAFEKLGEHVARGTGAVVAKNSRIGAQSFHLRAGCGGHIAQNLRQAGVVGLDAQAAAIPPDRGWGSFFVHRPARKHGRGRSDRQGGCLGCGV